MVHSMLIYTKKVTILMAFVAACTLGSLPSAASATSVSIVQTKSVSLAPSVNCKGMNARQCEQASIAAAKATPPTKPPAAVGPVKPPAATPAVKIPAFTPPTQPPAPVAPVKPPAPVVTVKLPSPVIPVKNLVTTNNDPSTKCGTAIYLCTSRANVAETPGVTTNFSVVDNFASNSSTVCTKSQQNASNTKCSAGAATQNIMKNFDNAATTAATLVKSGTDQVTIVFTGFNTVANSGPSTDNEKNSAMRAAQSASDFCGSTSTVRYANNGQVNGAASTDKCVIYYANQNNPTAYATAKTACELAAQNAQKICVLSTPQKVTNNNYNTQGLRVTSATITTKPTSSICCDSTTTTVPGGSTTTVPGGSTTTVPGGSTTTTVPGGSTTTVPGGTPTPGPGGTPTPGPGGSYTDIPGTAPDYSEYPEAIDPDTDEPWVISLVVNVKVPANYVANGKKTTLTSTVTLLCGDKPCGSQSLVTLDKAPVILSQKSTNGLCNTPKQLNCLYYAPDNGQEGITYDMYFYTPSLSSKQITTVVKVDANVTRMIPLEDGDFIEVNVNDYNTIYQVNGLKVPSNEISRSVLGSRG